VEVSGDEADARSRIEHAFREARLTPPDVGEVATALGLRVELTEKMAMLLVRQRVLVKVDSLLVHESALTGLKADLASLKAASVDSVVKLDVAAFKQRYGVTRKYAIPLLEYLDRERVTRRVGDSRIVI
jgi:selenocysteine-specific elongation factor